ncbi:hypothetical protein BGZ46_007012 [Entomortierella lignicola]|nr:hypothetical protein BGZ46_007012 [Entomortierella lignicola]
MTNSSEAAFTSPWFEGSVAAAVEIANIKSSILLVCIVEDSVEGSESSLFERRFVEDRVVSELSGLNLVSLRLVRHSADGMMFSQIYPVMVVPALYLIRNGLLTDFMNSTVDVDQMLERIKKAVTGHFQIPPPPNTIVPGSIAPPVDTSGRSNITASSPTATPLLNPEITLPSTSAISSSSATTSSTSGTMATSSVIDSHHGSDRSQDLKELMKERKMKREKEEKQLYFDHKAEKQREIDRRTSTKALTEAQRELAEKQNKKLKDQIEKEKREEAEYKKRVKQALEEDKARRKAEKEAARAAAAVVSGSSTSSQILTPTEIQSQNAGLTQARNDAAPALAYDFSRLNIRLFDGSSIRNTFKATDTLEKVREWIDQNSEQSENAYNIVQLIPSRTFTDESKMLRDLELCPSATLVLKKIASASSAYGSSGDGAIPTLLSYGWSALSLAGKVASGAYSTASYYNPLSSNNTASNSGNESAAGASRTSSTASSKKKDSEVSYNGTMAAESVPTRFTLLEIVNQCDSFPHAPDPKLEQLSFLMFIVDNVPVGRIHSSLVPHFSVYNQSRPIFYITETTVSFLPWLTDYESRSDAIADMLSQWRNDIENFPCLSGWRDELYGVYTHITNPETTKGGAALAIERSACGLFGVHAYGVHMNGYVQTGPKPSDVQMWIARRSLTKPTYPGMLDNMVAGGMGFGHSPQYTIIKESMEEATIPADIAKNAIPVGTISYIKLSKSCKETQPETQIIYDLELPKDIVPAPCDAEVQDFRLWTMDQVLKAIHQGEFKPNCACACLHFMIRKAVITPENEPDYLDIVHRLHRRIEFPAPKKWPTFKEQ